MGKNLNYQQAMEELEQIVREVEEESIDVDELSVKIKRAAELLDLCNKKLKASEAEVNKILQQIKDND